MVWNGIVVRVRRAHGREFDSVAEAAEDAGCNERCIRDACEGRAMTAAGHRWSYIDDSVGKEGKLNHEMARYNRDYPNKRAIIVVRGLV